MPTLQDLRKRKFRTVKAFAEVWGCSPSTASRILNGHHHLVFTRQEVQRLADMLGVSFMDCVDAANESFVVSHNTHCAPDAYWRLENRWKIEDDIKRRRRERGDLLYRLFEPLLTAEALAPFGLTYTATKEDVMRAFREKVKGMADGKGGYMGDMDALVQAKEKALAYVQRNA